MPSSITILLIWLLEFSRLGWHGRWRKSYWLAGIHCFCAGQLVGGGSMWLPFFAGAIVAFSFSTLWGDSTGNWWSQKLPRPLQRWSRWKVTSFLSSFPMEAYALWNISGLSLSSWEPWSWSSFGLGLCYVLAAASVPLFLWKDMLWKLTGMGKLRPNHWTPSIWGG